MRKVVSGFLVVFLAMLAVVGCSNSGRKSIKIGAAGPFTGELSKIGLDSLNAIKMAVEECNQSGGIDGKTVEVVVGDDAGDPAKGKIVADKFVADPDVLGVVGPMNSSVIAAALPVYEKAGLVIISQSGTTPELTEKGFKVMHRICPRDDAQGMAAAAFIYNEIKPTKVYILDDKTTYGQGLADQVEKGLKSYGLTQIKRDQVSTQDKDFSALVALIKSYNPEMVYMAFANPAQAAALAKQLAGVGVKPALMGGDGCRERDQLIGGGGEAVQGMFVTAIGRNVKEVPEAREFVQKFEGKYEGMSIFSGQSYEATKILLNAIKEAHKAGDLTRQGVLKALHATKDYKGILGFPVSFDAKGDLVGGEIFVLKVSGSDFVEVKKYTTGNIK
ncbi:MAG TPA: branched-chain amino acid ABC transporter substrate-binding protein [Firmicutes bacterium]|nr:branched-chain amino acid ABC transporter substrate-binding protein [Bacillota bacterium]